LSREVEASAELNAEGGTAEQELVTPHASLRILEPTSPTGTTNENIVESWLAQSTKLPQYTRYMLQDSAR